MSDVVCALRYDSGARRTVSLRELGVGSFVWREPRQVIAAEPVVATPDLPRTFTSVATDPSTGAVMVLDGAQNQLFRRDAPLLWTPVPLPSGAARLARVAFVSTTEWVVVDQTGRLWLRRGATWSNVGSLGAAPTAMVVDRARNLWFIPSSGTLTGTALPLDGKPVGSSFTLGFNRNYAPGPGSLCIGRNGELFITQTSRRRITIVANHTMSQLVGADFPIDAPDLISAGPDGSIVCRNAPHAPTRVLIGGQATTSSGGEFFRRDPSGQWSRLTGADDPTCLSFGVDAAGAMYFGGAALGVRAGWAQGTRSVALPSADGRFVWMGQSRDAAFQDRIALPYVALAPDGSELGGVVVQIGVGTEPAVDAAPSVGAADVVTVPAAAVPVPLTALGGGPLTFSVGASTPGGADLSPSHGTLGAVAAIAAPPPQACVVYTPTAGFTGQDAFTFRASSQGKTSGPARVRVTVNAQAPVAVQVPPGGATALPAPGVLGGLTGRRVDVSQRRWAEVRWPGLRGPTSVGYQGAKESVWVTTPGDFRARAARRDPSGVVSPVGGRAGGAAFEAPSSVVAVAGAVFVADPQARAVFMRLAMGVWLQPLRDVDVGGLAVYEGEVYLTNPVDGTIARMGAVPSALEPLGTGATGERPTQPLGIAVGASGIWVTDAASNAVYRLAGGAWTRFAPDLDVPGPLPGPRGISIAGPTDVELLGGPTGIAVDRTGLVWITDTGTNRIVTLNPSGTPTWSVVDTQHGALSAPQGISVDEHGGVWVADTGNDRLLHLACFVDGACVRAELRADGSAILTSLDGRIGTDTLAISATSRFTGVDVPALGLQVVVTVPTNTSQGA